MHRFRYDGTGPARSFRARLPSSRIVLIGKSGGEGADGLGRPTFVEHGIAAVPLPYLGTSTIVALLATGPGYLLARLIESGGGLEQNRAGKFCDAPPPPPPPSVPALLPSRRVHPFLPSLPGELPTSHPPRPRS